jgi:UDP-3-O-[3-hydroxymyristoyl] N-acetylglucosamine deacetylase
MKKNQTTIQKSISFSGIGVHSGNVTSVTLNPASLGLGIVFKNAKNLESIITVGKVIPEVAMHATVIRGDQNNSWAVSTIEHLMAAISMMGIDHLEIVVDGAEIPILDGGALPFVHGIVDAGLVFFDIPKRFITPTGELSIDYNAEFMHPLAGPSTFFSVINQDVFMHEIAPARTFGHLEQLPFLRQHGLARGTSLGNTVVIGQELLNDMRFADECVRHKVLDLLGDMSMAGTRIAGAIKATKTGHAFNRLVALHVIQHPEKWDVLTY